MKNVTPSALLPPVPPSSLPLPCSPQYYLVDDTLEVREVHQPNDGRDPFPVLIGRHKVPIDRYAVPSSFPGVVMELSDNNFVAKLILLDLGRRVCIRPIFHLALQTSDVTLCSACASTRRLQLCRSVGNAATAFLARVEEDAASTIQSQRPAR